MNLLLLPFRGLWFFFVVFVGCLVVSCIPIPEVPTISSEKTILKKVVNKEEEGVYVSKEVMEDLVSLYYHHIDHHDLEQHSHPPELINPHHHPHRQKQTQNHHHRTEPSQTLL
jgi:hypothetical protein